LYVLDSNWILLHGFDLINGLAILQMFSHDMFLFDVWCSFKIASDGEIVG